MIPRVSITIPTYNRAQVIGRALRSVLAQTFTLWECLVVDDASTDGTEEIVRAFDDPRIRYLRHDVNKGAPAARNTGMKEARGEYLAFLDSDDEWLPTKLEKQLAVFEATRNPHLGAVLCGRIQCGPSEHRTVPGPRLYGDIFRIVLTQGLGGLGTSGYLVRRSVLESGIWFDESLPACQDRDFMVRISRDFHIEALSEPLIRQYRDQGGDHIWNELNAARGLDLMIVKYFEHLRRWPEDLSSLHTSVGIKYLLVDQTRLARYHFIGALRYEPLHLSTYIWILACFSGPRAARWLQRWSMRRVNR